MAGSTDPSKFIRGHEYVQIFQAYPALEQFYFDFEKNYNPLPILDYMATLNYSVPVAVVILYLLLCYIGTNYMKGREPFNILNQLAIWNLILAIFSIYGTIRVVPHFLFKLS